MSRPVEEYLPWGQRLSAGRRRRVVPGGQTERFSSLDGDQCMRQGDWAPRSTGAPDSSQGFPWIWTGSGSRGEPAPAGRKKPARAAGLSGARRGRRQGLSRLKVTLPLITRWEQDRRPNRQSSCTLPFPRANRLIERHPHAEAQAGKTTRFMGSPPRITGRRERGADRQGPSQAHGVPAGVERASHGLPVASLGRHLFVSQAASGHAFSSWGCRGGGPEASL
jgi:hypothetical protein